MRVTAAGARTFVLYRRIRGRPTRITLGRLRQHEYSGCAQGHAAALLGQVAAGVDVVAEIKAARIRGRTVGDAFRHLAFRSRSTGSGPGRTTSDCGNCGLERPLSRTRPCCGGRHSPELERLTQSIGSAASADSQQVSRASFDCLGSTPCGAVRCRRIPCAWSNGSREQPRAQRCATMKLPGLASSRSCEESATWRHDFSRHCSPASAARIWRACVGMNWI